MESYEHRVINGLLKSQVAAIPEHVEKMLARNFEIIVPPDRASSHDLWPAIWALAAVLQRQFSGIIYIRSGLWCPLEMPESLGPRCHFVTDPQINTIRIGLGCMPDGAVCFGDARGNSFSVGAMIDNTVAASPYSCFAAAGYLGFAALAVSVGIPAHREQLARREYSLRIPDKTTFTLPENGITFVGLGHLGNAYLALLFFLAQAANVRPRIHLIDKEIFQEPNIATQILLQEDGPWLGCEKATYLQRLLSEFGWDVSHEVRKLDWGWRRNEEHPSLLVLGLDNFETRRIALEGGYDWVFDAGLNSSFETPRVSWNALPPDRAVGLSLFMSEAPSQKTDISPQFRALLEATPGACGLITFGEVKASAPCMGLVAAALVWTEIASYLAGDVCHCEASLFLWSPILPPLEMRVPSQY